MVVSRIAFGFRVLSYIIISPLVIVAILDIVAYVIARTLQAFDDLPHFKLGQTGVNIIINEKEVPPYKKLSDGDDPTNKKHHANPPLEVDREWKGNTDALSSSGGVSGDNSGNNSGHSASLMSPAYAANEELSGVGLFSPAPTRPATPTFHRERKGSSVTSTLGSSFLNPPGAPLGES